MKSVRIVFRPDSEFILPLAHFDMLQGLFYKLLSFDSDLADKVHSGEGFRRRYKYCCFTDISGKRMVEGKSLAFSGPLEWEIRSMDDAVVDVIASALKDKMSFSLADVRCEMEGLEIRQNEFYTTRMLAGMDTPLVLCTTDSEGYNHYRNPWDEDFCAMAERNLAAKFREYYDAPLTLPVTFRPLRVSERDKCVTRFMGIYVTGYYGLYELKAQPEIISLAYYAGLGSKNTQGFGTIRTVTGE